MKAPVGSFLSDNKFDDNGNLVNDGANTYVYDSSNRLVSVNATETYSYNGLGDRLTQNGTQYVLDLNAGLTQVLNDGTNSYLYGLGRISQTNSETEYFLGDALGSVRQLIDSTGEITLVNTYEPYGNTVSTIWYRRIYIRLHRRNNGPFDRLRGNCQWADLFTRQILQSCGCKVYFERYLGGRCQ